MSNDIALAQAIRNTVYLERYVGRSAAVWRSRRKPGASAIVLAHDACRQNEYRRLVRLRNAQA